MTMPLARNPHIPNLLGYSFTREGRCLLYQIIVDENGKQLDDLAEMKKVIDKSERKSDTLVRQFLRVPENEVENEETILETLFDSNARCEKHDIPEFTEAFIRHLRKNCSGEEDIGAGGQATIKKGKTKNNIEIAIKIMKKTSNIPKAAEKAEKEIEVTNYLRHTNIVSLLGISTTSFGLCFLYPFVRGKDLKTILLDHDDFLKAKQRFRIILELADAIHHIHEKAYKESGKVLVHSDIQPSNIMIENFDENDYGKKLKVKLIDFGILNEFEVTKNKSGQDVTTHITKTMHLVGVDRYVPPEGLPSNRGGKAEIHRSRDIFAFGMVLMDILTDEKGYAAECVSKIDSLQQDLKEILKLKVDWNGKEKETGVDLIKMARRCIDQNKDNRPGMKEIVEEFETDTFSKTFASPTKKVNFEES